MDNIWRELLHVELNLYISGVFERRSARPPVNSTTVNLPTYHLDWFSFLLNLMVLNILIARKIIISGCISFFLAYIVKGSIMLISYIFNCKLRKNR